MLSLYHMVCKRCPLCRSVLSMVMWSLVTWLPSPATVCREAPPPPIPGQDWTRTRPRNLCWGTPVGCHTVPPFSITPLCSDSFLLDFYSFFFFSDPKIGSLYITNISQFEFGEYQCSASNDVGAETCTVELNHGTGNICDIVFPCLYDLHTAVDTDVTNLTNNPPFNRAR